jgi:hypothetical protein
MGKIIRLTESDLVKLVKRVLIEQSDVAKNWDKVKNYLLTTGFDGAKGREDTDLTVEVKGKSFIYTFFDSGEVLLKYVDVPNNYTFARNNWAWDGSKVILTKPLPSVTKKASGYAQTIEDITSGNKIVGLGSRGDLVKKIQRAVFYDSDTNIGCKTNEKGYVLDWSDCDGIYGQKTKEAVKNFQRTNGLSVDGNVGKQTLAFLDDEILK